MIPYTYPISKRDVSVRLTHEYVTNCTVLTQVQEYFFLFAIGYALIIAIWMIMIWVVYADQNCTL
jgi:hypothetical protein